MIGKTPRDCMVRAYRISGLDMTVEDFTATLLDMGLNPKTRSPGEDRWHLDFPKLTKSTAYLNLRP